MAIEPEIKIDKLVRSRRRTTVLIVTREGELEVRAPLCVPLEVINDFIVKKQRWIREKQESAKSKLQRIHPRNFIHGEEFLYLGNSYRLHLVDDIVVSNAKISHSKGDVNGSASLSTVSISTDDNMLYFPGRLLPYARHCIAAWYRQQALLIIEERVKLYAGKMGASACYLSIRVSNATKRWGSCSANNSLNFAWRLVMAPLSVIDYVVVHELCHMFEKNHSRNFWRKVEAVMPDYKKRMQWLKQHGYTLVI